MINLYKILEIITKLVYPILFWWSLFEVRDFREERKKAYYRVVNSEWYSYHWLGVSVSYLITTITLFLYLLVTNVAESMRTENIEIAEEWGKPIIAFILMLCRMEGKTILLCIYSAAACPFIALWLKNRLEFAFF